MKSCAVRVLGPEVAKTMVPRLLLRLTGSSLIFSGSGCGVAGMPNCATKPSTTRKKAAPSYQPSSASLLNCAAPPEAHSGWILTLKLAFCTSPARPDPLIARSNLTLNGISVSLVSTASALMSRPRAVAARATSARQALADMLLHLLLQLLLHLLLLLLLLRVEREGLRLLLLLRGPGVRDHGRRGLELLRGILRDGVRSRLRVPLRHGVRGRLLRRGVRRRRGVGRVRRGRRRVRRVRGRGVRPGVRRLRVRGRSREGVPGRLRRVGRRGRCGI
mmetsp:Transcript_21526/g.56126  ORF Transcript_21526/g.56126 Transcript_21526/m.56126 type:complete len:275 (-) Transcript_21526:405-1229(-)